MPGWRDFVLPFRIYEISKPVAREFVSDWHYSGTCPVITYALGLYLDNELYGVLVFARPNGRGSKQAYGNVLEISRLVLLDEAPRNSESWFIARALKWLKSKDAYVGALAYADPYYGHDGMIYRASNFRYSGRTHNSCPVIWKGKLYHRRIMNGTSQIARDLRAALDNGEARFSNRPGKYIYLYYF